ncbi:hypothetical protein HK101_003900 [Irineochytrium annulatum]|nr:hypothetical protein HK101_003900 [Irineochytrium annulatum]
MVDTTGKRKRRGADEALRDEDLNLQCDPSQIDFNKRRRESFEGVDGPLKQAFRRGGSASTDSPVTPSEPPNAFNVLMMKPADRASSALEACPPLTASPKVITDRGSRFLAHACKLEDHADLRRLQASIPLNPKIKSATHNMRAWRYLSLRPGRSGDAEDDFVVVEGFEEDGEQWAGAKILKLMQVSGACDCAVIVSRWYGGELLGPVRFHHIEAVALSALQTAGFVTGGPTVTAPCSSSATLPSPTSATGGATKPPATPQNQSATFHSPAPSPERARLIRLIRARSGTLASLRHHFATHRLQQLRHQKSMRTLNGTREDDLESSPVKGRKPMEELEKEVEKGPAMPPSEEEVLKEVERRMKTVGSWSNEESEMEEMIKVKDNEIAQLKIKISDLKVVIADQEARLVELSFRMAKRGNPL